MHSLVEGRCDDRSFDRRSCRGLGSNNTRGRKVELDEGFALNRW